MKKFLIIIGFVATIMMATVPVSLAVENLDPSFLPKGMPTLSGTKAVEDYGVNYARIVLVQRFLNVVMSSAAIIATFFILYSGFNLVISHGEDDKMGPAKKGLTWALLGLVFIMLSYSIMSFVIKTALSAEDPDAAGESTSDQIDAGNSKDATYGKTPGPIPDEMQAQEDFAAVKRSSESAAVELGADRAAAELAADRARLNVK